MEKWTEAIVEQLNEQYDFVLSGTGSRSFDRFDDQDLRDKVDGKVAELIKSYEHPLVVSGGAQGFDHYLARMAYRLGVPYVLLIPSPDYPSYYWRQRGSVDHQDHIDIWKAMVDHSVGVYYVNDDPRGRKTGRFGHANFDRNEEMMKFADHVLVWDPSTPGTRHAFGLVKEFNTAYTLVNML